MKESWQRQSERRESERVRARAREREHPRNCSVLLLLCTEMWTRSDERLEQLLILSRLA